MRPTARTTLLLGATLIGGCVFDSLQGVASVAQISNPVPRLLAISDNNIAVVVDQVALPGPGKLKKTTIKAFNTAGTLLASETLADLRRTSPTYRPMACTDIVALGDTAHTATGRRLHDVIDLRCSEGTGYQLLVPRSAGGTMSIDRGGVSRLSSTMTRVYTDFSMPNWDNYGSTSDEQKLMGAGLFTAEIPRSQSSHRCNGRRAPFLAWSNGSPGTFRQTPIDLSGDLGCDVASLRISVDETRSEWAILGDDTLVFMKWNPYSPSTPAALATPTITARVPVGTGSRNANVDVGYRHGQVAIARNIAIGSDRIVLLDRASLTVTNHINVKRAVAVDIHGPGSKTPPHMWFVGEDSSGTYSLGRAGLLPNP
ncbi:MAG: hypothetical protein AB8H79_07510 [Myxococcota bacterium]